MMHADVLERPARSKLGAGRDTTINIRASRETKELIESAASIEGKTLSEFTLESASKRAIDVLLDQRLFLLDAEKFAAFTKALDSPPAAGPKLKALMKRRPLWQK